MDVFQSIRIFPFIQHIITNISLLYVHYRCVPNHIPYPKPIPYLLHTVSHINTSITSVWMCPKPPDVLYISHNHLTYSRAFFTLEVKSHYGSTVNMSQNHTPYSLYRKPSQTSYYHQPNVVISQKHRSHHHNHFHSRHILNHMS